MAEVLIEFENPVIGSNDRAYVSRVCGRETADGRWEGWLEFVPGAGGVVVRTSRETVQPRHADLRYWATGLTATYLEGALERALHPLTAEVAEPEPQPAYDGPAPPGTAVGAAGAAGAAGESTVLDPFVVYAQGEERLRSQLAALDEAHLRRIVRAYRLVDETEVDLSAMRRTGLAELVLAAVRRRTE